MMMCRTACFWVLLFAVAAGCSSRYAGYKRVATISIDESNQLVVTADEDAAKHEIPQVVSTGNDYQVIALGERHRTVIRARNQEVKVNEFSQKESKTRKVTKKVTKTIKHEGEGFLSLESETSLAFESTKGEYYSYFLDDVIRIQVYYKYNQEGQRETGAFDKKNPYMSKRTAGVGLTTLGLLCLAGVPISLAVNAGLGSAAGMVIFGISSIPLLSIGIPLWIIGSDRMKWFEKKSAGLPEPTIAISTDTNTYGLGLRWRL